MKPPRLLMPVFAFLLAVFAYPLAGGAPPPKSPVPKKATPSKSAPGQSKARAAGKSGAKSGKSSAKGTARKKSSRKTPPKVRAQQQPTPDRIREIQQALTDKGYPVPVTGAWGDDSVAALKRFQQDQNMAGRGKLDSLTLISLGLGPRREPAPQVAAPVKEIRP